MIASQYGGAVCSMAGCVLVFGTPDTVHVNVAVHCVASSTNVTTRRPIRGDSTLKVRTKLPLESKSTKLSPIKVRSGTTGSSS